MKNATLYFHFPCFDGLVSCVLAWDFLERRKAWTIEGFEPVNYDVRQTWLSAGLKIPCGVVDFLYHPSAEFWADHHQTAFLTPEAKADFCERRSSAILLYDDLAGSCASLLYRNLQEDAPGRPHFPEMVEWAEKIDSARYASVQEAILGEAPALQINRSLLQTNGPEYGRFLLKALREHDLGQVAGLSEVKLRHDEVLRRTLAGLKQVEKRLRVAPGGIATFEAEKNQEEIINRYAAYHFVPTARYSIGVIRSDEGTAITAMRNPWLEFPSIPLGRIFEKFGGGGHQRVGSVLIPKNQGQHVPDVVESLLSQMS